MKVPEKTQQRRQPPQPQSQRHLFPNEVTVTGQTGLAPKEEHRTNRGTQAEPRACSKGAPRALTRPVKGTPNLAASEGPGEDHRRGQDGSPEAAHKRKEDDRVIAMSGTDLASKRNG